MKKSMIGMIEHINELKELGFNYFIAAVGEADEHGDRPCYHICGYPQPPGVVDYDALAKELKTDGQFAMTNMSIGEDYHLVEIQISMLKEL